jgi:hypothetical protein
MKDPGRGIKDSKRNIEVKYEMWTGTAVEEKWIEIRQALSVMLMRWQLRPRTHAVCSREWSRVVRE